MAPWVPVRSFLESKLGIVRPFFVGSPLIQSHLHDFDIPVSVRRVFEKARDDATWYFNQIG